MAMVVLSYVQNLWPFSAFKFDDIRASDRLVNKLAIPESTKRFVFAIQEPESQSVIYVLCVQNLSERSALDVECLIREVKPDAVVAQVGMENEGLDEIVSKVCNGSNRNDGSSDTYLVPTSSFEVLRRCFIHKINKEKYENAAGNLVLREIFGVGFNGNFLSAKKAAEEVGASLLLLESPFVKCVADGECSVEREEELGKGLWPSGLQPNSLVPQRGTSTGLLSSRGFYVMNDFKSHIVKSLSSSLIDSDSAAKVASNEVQPRDDYEAPQFAQSIYPLFVDLHNIFIDIPSMGRALAHAQKMFSDINKGEVVETRLLSEVYAFRIAVEALRIALNNAGRLPMGKPANSKADFSALPIEDKSHALVAEALRSQTKRFKSIVAVVDASGLAGLRKHWSTHVPVEIKDMVEQLVTDCENHEKLQSFSERKRLSEKPMVAVGAGATAVLGASSLSKLVPASTYAKILTYKIPSSLKLMITQTQKVVAIAFGKTVGPSKVVIPGMASGAQTSALKALASAEKIRAIAHSIIASAEKTSLSAMRTAFYEIMRNRRVRPVGLLPWATFGCSVATCASLLVYGDGIECAAESVPSAPSIASLGRGIQSLHQASEAVRQAESSRIQKSIESLLYRFRKIKVQ